MPGVSRRLSTVRSSIPPVRFNPPEDEQIDALVKTLTDRSVARSDITVAKAPLRICPLGAHIDHQLGIVTGMTIDQSVLLAFAPSGDSNVHIESQNFTGVADFGLNSIPPAVKGEWANYVRGAAHSLQSKYGIKQGINGVIGGAMPIGGLSSSAAVTIAYLLALAYVNDLDLTPYDNVELCRMTENGYIGLQNGILDQSVILFSEINHLTRIDCESVEVSLLPAPKASSPDPFEILVVYSGISDALTGTDYNNRVEECRLAASAMLEADGRDAPDDARLRHVPATVFRSYGGTLPEANYRRAKHFYGEMERVTHGEIAWSQGNIQEFGRLVNESGESSVRWYECGSPQLITLYEALRNAPGVYGARFSGAGFRGSCVALIEPDAREAIADAVHSVYPVAHPNAAKNYSIHYCRPDSGACLLAPESGMGW